VVLVRAYGNGGTRVYGVIKDGDVKWKPAVDVNRIILGSQVVTLAATLVAARFLLASSKTTAYAETG
jgi:hypothetical protein